VGDEGGTVETDGGGSASDPVGTSVAVPAGTGGGTVVIAEVQITQAPDSGGWTFVSQQVNIAAPDGTVANPLILTFDLYAPGTTNPHEIQMFKDGFYVPLCTDSGAAVPDPCVENRALSGDTVRIVVRTSTASAWNFGVLADPAGCLCVPSNVVPGRIANLTEVGDEPPGDLARQDRSFSVVMKAQEVSKESCPDGAISPPVMVHVVVTDDDGDQITDQVRGPVVCFKNAFDPEIETFAKFTALFVGPENCKDSAVPPKRSTGAINFVVTSDDGSPTLDIDKTLSCRN
jgi:hypothetical protein